MGRLERKLIALLVLVAGLPLLVAFLISRGVFERSIQAAVHPEIEQGIEESVQFFREFIRAEKGRQRAIARGLSQDATLAGLAEARDRDGLEAYLLPFVRRPRVLRLKLEIPAKGDQQALTIDLTPHRDDNTTRWREDTLEKPLNGSAERGVLTYTYGLEQAYFDRFTALEHQAVAPMAAIKADQENQAAIMAWSFMASLGLAVLVASVLAVYIGRRTTRRLSRLRHAMVNVAGGDLEVRVVPEGRDEVADLARHFNEMADGLAESYDRVQYLTQISAWQGIARRMAHEIKNPLTPILLSVQQAHSRYRGDDTGFRKVIDTTREIVEAEVETLRRLVSEFSEFARLPQVQLEPLDLSALPDELKMAHPEVEHLEAHSAESPVQAMADRGLLKQALSNLVINAWDAANETDAPPQVAVHVVSVDNHVQIHVDDSGPGVPADMRGKIFEPYHTGKAHGTGLGLAIVKKVIIDHKGRIEVGESPLGGARFTVWLPTNNRESSRPEVTPHEV
ncbi:MAG: ATP-binding protein [Bradymonadia bacterium]